MWNEPETRHLAVKNRKRDFLDLKRKRWCLDSTETLQVHWLENKQDHKQTRESFFLTIIINLHDKSLYLPWHHYFCSILFSWIVYIDVLVSQSWLPLCDPMDCSHQAPLSMEILQARMLENGIAIPFSRGSSRPRDWTRVSCLADRFFTVWAARVLAKKSPPRHLPALEVALTSHGFQHLTQWRPQHRPHNSKWKAWIS